MTRRPWLGVGVSVVVHVALCALVVVSFARDESRAPLVVDLRDGFVPDPAPAHRAAGGSTNAGGRSSVLRRWRLTKREAPAPAPRGREAPAPPPAPIAEAAPAPAPPPAPKVEPPREPPAIAPAPAVSTPPTPMPSATVAAGDKPSSSGRASGGDNRVAGPSGSAAGAAVTGNGSAPAKRDDAGSGAGGRPGQALARAAPGTGSGVGAEYGPYLMALRQRIQHSVRYPASARRRGISGTVSVEILILPNGAVGDVQLLESSTHQVLDDAALDTIRSLPRMPLPPELPARPLRVRVPVVFQIQ